MFTAEFWVGVSFLLFVGILIYRGVPGMIASALDRRAEQIRKELAEAQRLREEAQTILAQMQRKESEAKGEAQAILDLARQEAEFYALETRRKLAETVERRTRLAEQKIAQAEAQALKEVRSAATDIAISAAARLIAEEVKGDKAAALVDDSIAAVKARLQ
jgi:F-type H+-transporting ATPase subunit b